MSGTETTARRKAATEVADAVGRPGRTGVGQDLFESAPRGPQLEVGSADDAAEHAADRLADRVIARLRTDDTEHGEHDGHGLHEGHDHGPARRVAGAVRRAVAPRVGREGGPAGAELSARIESMRGGGATLDEGVRRRMGSAFGTDLSGVRVHTDSRAADAAADMGALAFTTGKDIFFGAGQYAPDTAEGQHVLAHELAHTVAEGDGARRKVSRMWDLKAPNLPLQNTQMITALEKRPVWFFEDRDGDRIVIKKEKDLIGLGELVGKMQKKLSDVKTIKYRKLSGSEASFADDLIDFDFAIDYESWKKRGQYVKQAGDHDDFDDVAAARDVAHQDMSGKAPLVAMSLAEGEGAEDLAKAPPGGGGSKLRAIVSRPGHIAKLAELSAVDLFMGNLDRVYSGNLGNWFYDPSGQMTVIDNVDGGNAMSAQWKNNDIDDNGVDKLRTRDLRLTAETIVDGLRVGFLDNGDDDANTWFREVQEDGKTRQEHFNEEFYQAFVAARARIIKIFLTTRWTLGGKNDRKLKKSLKESAKAANQVDDGDNTTNYYTMMKARAAWLKKN